jgi:hypothetical protein
MKSNPGIIIIQQIWTLIRFTTASREIEEIHTYPTIYTLNPLSPHPAPFHNPSNRSQKSSIQCLDSRVFRLRPGIPQHMNTTLNDPITTQSLPAGFVIVLINTDISIHEYESSLLDFFTHVIRGSERSDPEPRSFVYDQSSSNRQQTAPRTARSTLGPGTKQINKSR